MVKKPVTNQSEKKSKPSIRLLFVLILVLAVAAAAFFYLRYKEVQGNQGHAIVESGGEEIELVLNDLKTVMLVDESDPPTVARVDNPNKLKDVNEAFYRSVEKDDYLIIYPTRAILFRQSNKLIVNVAPVIDTRELLPNGGNSEQQ